jgi:hypothetical protein
MSFKNYINLSYSYYKKYLSGKKYVFKHILGQITKMLIITNIYWQIDFFRC